LLVSWEENELRSVAGWRFVYGRFTAGLFALLSLLGRLFLFGQISLSFGLLLLYENRTKLLSTKEVKSVNILPFPRISLCLFYMLFSIA